MKEKTVGVNVRLPEVTAAMLDEMCKKNFRSRQNMINFLIVEHHNFLNRKRVVMVGNNDVAVVDPEWAAQA